MTPTISYLQAAAERHSLRNISVCNVLISEMTRYMRENCSLTIMRKGNSLGKNGLECQAMSSLLVGLLLEVNSEFLKLKAYINA